MALLAVADFFGGLLLAIVLEAWSTGSYDWIPPALSAVPSACCWPPEVLPRCGKWSFTIWIATAVAVGMAYPTYFIGIGEFKFTRLFVPILQVITFCMGTTLSLGDFARVFRMPMGVVVGLVCQFSIMPLVGWGLATAFRFPPEIAAGVVLVGSSPSGLASNVMAFIAKANVAMSVTMTAIATLLAPLMTPFLMKTLAGQMIEVDAVAMMWSITKMVLIPILGGLAFHHALYHRAAWLDRVMPVISMVGIILMTILTVAIGRDNLLELGVILSWSVSCTVRQGTFWAILRVGRCDWKNGIAAQSPWKLACRIRGWRRESRRPWGKSRRWVSRRSSLVRS